MKYIQRIIALPFVMGLMVIASVINLLKRSFQFIKYGGETSVYDKEINAKTLYDAYMNKELLQGIIEKLDGKK